MYVYVCVCFSLSIYIYICYLYIQYEKTRIWTMHEHWLVRLYKHYYDSGKTIPGSGSLSLVTNCPCVFFKHRFGLNPHLELTYQLTENSVST